MKMLTRQEQQTFNLMAKKSSIIVSRDEIAQAIWGPLWLKKYSDWRIDRLIYLLRGKLPKNYSIKTMRNVGYMLVTGDIQIEKDVSRNGKGILPTKSYLEYMNNTKNQRQTIANHFSALGKLPSAKKILVINSYSFDNVDALAKAYPKSEVYFTNFDSRAVSLHQRRIADLKLSNYHSNFDEIRNTLFKNNAFDMVINDFRLNFNTSNAQNKLTIINMYNILKTGGNALVSVVVDPRFESDRYGANQEKAPINKDKPWKFIGQEGLERKCFTLPYYKQLFENAGFKIVKEFDIEQGKKWNLPYRRFILTK